MLALRIALQNLYFRPVLTVVTLVVVGLAVAQAAAVLLLARAIENSLVRASRPFDLLVGAKGSPPQLIMNAILLRDAPVGNIPLAYFDKLQHDPRVASAVPLALGDSAYGAPLLGAGLALFELADPTTRQPYFALAQGRLFAQTFEAVAGAQAARRWQIGDTFASQHRFLQDAPGPAHAASYTIVGVLHPSDTPLDRALFVPLDSYWHLHETDEAAEHQITVAMLRPTGLTEVYQLYQEINRDTVAQAVLTGQGMLRLFNMLGQNRATPGFLAGSRDGSDDGIPRQLRCWRPAATGNGDSAGPGCSALDCLYGWARRSAHHRARRHHAWRYERAYDGMVYRLEGA